MGHFAKALFAVLLLAAGSTPALAQMNFGRMDTGLYLGASLGGSEVRNACEGLPAGVSCDEKDFAFRAFAGWQFNRHLGIETGYARMGDVDLSAPGVTGTIGVRGWDLVGVFSYPFSDKIAVYGKAGVARMKASGSVTGVAPGGVLVTLGASDWTTDLTYGLGARFNFTRNISARLEWQRYHDVSDAKVDYLSIGLLYGWY